MVGVGAVIFKNDQLLLVKRRFEPKAQFWSLPGGLVEWGETVEEAIIRETREECGIEIDPIRLVDVIDFIDRDERGEIRYHYVLVDFEACYLGGEVAPQSDAADARWFSPSELTEISLPEITRKFLQKHYSL